jgi:hypothetical protein
MAAVPPGGTVLDTFKRSFTDVPIDAEKNNAISTTEFLDAAESLTGMFGMVANEWEVPRSSDPNYGGHRCPRIPCFLSRQE